MLRRHGESGNMDDLNLVLHEWEHWAAELLESQSVLSSPVLLPFATRQSIVVWGALTTVLDTCALVLVGIDGAPPGQAKLTFAMARHAVDRPWRRFSGPLQALRSPASTRLYPGDLERIQNSRANSARLEDGEEAEEKLASCV